MFLVVLYICFEQESDFDPNRHKINAILAFTNAMFGLEIFLSMFRARFIEG
jgi:hypothetical protein